MKLNIPKYLAEKKAKPMKEPLWSLARNLIIKPFVSKGMKVEVIDKVGMKNAKGPFFVVSNHTSRCDYIYLCEALKHNPSNFVVSYTEFFRSHMHTAFKIFGMIPKKNFVPDTHAIREITEVIKKGGNVIIFPEGKSSISGTNQPVMLGSGKMIKHFNIPVYYTRISGGYMQNTQWNIANRIGKAQIVIDKLYDPEDIEKLTAEEIDFKLNEVIHNDDFEWNKTNRVKFKGNETVAIKLEEHLYLCPKCGGEATNKGEKNVIKCTKCGNGAMIDEYYDLHPLDESCVIPKNLRIWFELQRRDIYRTIKANEDFRLEENVKLGCLPTDHYVKGKKISSEICGEGKLILTRNDLSFVGTKNGQPFEMKKSILDIPSVVFETDSSYFGTYAFKDYYEFYPERPLGTKWLLAVEECHRLAGGKWQNIIPEQQWIYEDDKPTDKEEYYL